MQKWQRILMGVGAYVFFDGLVGAGLFALSIGVLSPVFWLKPLQVIIGGLLIFAAHRPNQVALSATVLYFVGLSVVAIVTSVISLVQLPAVEAAAVAHCRAQFGPAAHCVFDRLHALLVMHVVFNLVLTLAVQTCFGCCAAGALYRYRHQDDVDEALLDGDDDKPEVVEMTDMDTDAGETAPVPAAPPADVDVSVEIADENAALLESAEPEI